MDDSILLVAGAHCRLEDISQEAEASKEVWLRDIEFEIGGVQTVRKKGEPVGNTMAPWRKVRRERPEKLAGK